MSSIVFYQVLWWDIRNFKEPTDDMVLDPLRAEPADQKRAFTALCLEHEATMPTKFMVGTEQGAVVACNRRARKRKDRLSKI